MLFVSTKNFLKFLIIFEKEFVVLQRTNTTTFPPTIYGPRSLFFSHFPQNFSNYSKKFSKISAIFEKLFKIISRTSGINSAILKISENISDDSISKISDVLETLIEVCYARCKMLFVSRNPQVESLERSQICEQMEKAFNFITKIETLCSKVVSAKFRNSGGNSTILKGALLEQGQIYLTEFHKRQMESFKQKVDLDKWNWEKAFDVDLARAQQIVDKITKNVSSGPVGPAMSGFDSFVESLATESSGDAAADGSGAPETLGFLRLKKDQVFPVSRSVVELVFVVDLYFDLFEQPFIQSFELAKKLYFLFSAYNKQVGDVVLGAKAIKTANLRTISSHNVMLASECINFVAKFISELLPLITSRISSSGASGTASQASAVLSDYNVLLSDFTEHSDKLFGKIHEMVDTLLNSATSSWKTMLWNEKGKTPSDVMFNLFQKLNFIRRMLIKYLATHKKVLIAFFSEIVGKYTTALKDIIENSKFEVEIKTDIGKARLWADIVTFKKSIQKWGGPLNNDTIVNLNQLEFSFTKKYGPPPQINPNLVIPSPQTPEK